MPLSRNHVHLIKIIHIPSREQLHGGALAFQLNYTCQPIHQSSQLSGAANAQSTSASQIKNMVPHFGVTHQGHHMK